MDVLHLILYVVASFLALRSLVALMSSHKARYKQRRLAEIAREQGMAAHSPAQAKSKAAASRRPAA